MLEAERARVCAPRMTPPGAPEPTARRVSANRLSLIVVAVIVAAGVAFRLWLALGATSRPDSDEAIVGLMALQLLRHGQTSAFYWLQNYGGGLEAFAVAPSLAVFGSNTFGLVFPSLVFGFVASWLTWRITRHFYEPWIAATAGLLSLFWPAASVWFGTKERGFYPMTATLGLLAVLLAVNIDREPGPSWRWLGMGVTAGIGWWMSPNIVYYLLPLALWLALRGHWRALKNITIAAAGALAGSAVWWYANVHSGFASLEQPRWGGTSTYGSRFAFYWSHGLPFALGLRRPWSDLWAPNARVGLLLYVLLLALLGATLVAAMLGRESLFRSPDLVLLAASPFVFATFVANWKLLEGRYEYFVASIVPIVMCRVLTLRVGRVILAAVAIVSVWSVARDDVPRIARTRMRPSTVPIANALRAAGYRTAIGDHWVAYQLTFESDERVIAVRLPVPRYEGYARIVRSSNPAYVFRTRSKGEPYQALLERALRARQIAFREVTAGGYVAVLPASPFLPAS